MSMQQRSRMINDGLNSVEISKILNRLAEKLLINKISLWVGNGSYKCAAMHSVIVSRLSEPLLRDA